MIVRGLGERFPKSIDLKNRGGVEIGSMNYDQLYPTKKRFEGLRAESILAPTITGQQVVTTPAAVTSSVTAAQYFDSGGNAIYIFKNINCPAGTDPVAETLTDTLNLTGTGITITGDNSTDTVNFALTTQGSVYTPTNVTTDRAYNADAQGSAYSGINNLQVGNVYAQLSDLNLLRLSHNEIADVLGTLIADLKSSGIIS